MKRVGEKNRCLEKEKERKRVWNNVDKKKISRIIKKVICEYMREQGERMLIIRVR